MTDKKLSIFSKLTIGIISMLFLFGAICSPIFFNVPKYIYLNISGIIIAGIYFNVVESILFVVIAQLMMVKFGLASVFPNYTTIVWLTSIIFVNVSEMYVRKFKSHIKKLGVLYLCSFVMLLISKPISIILAKILISNDYNIADITKLSIWIDQIQICFFSIVVAYFVGIIVDKIIKYRWNNEI